MGAAPIGAVQDTTSELSALVAATAVGEPGGPGGPVVVAVAAPEVAPVPMVLRATTVNVYAVELASPETEQVVAVVVHVAPPGVAVTR